MNYNFEHIDDYIQGTISAEEKQKLEAEMQNDATLKALVEEYRTVNNSLSKIQFNNENQKSLEQILTPLTNEHFVKKATPIFTLKRVAAGLAIAASIALIITLAIPGTSASDFSFTPMPGGEIRGTQSEIAAAAKAFNKADYELASVELEKLYNADSSSSIVANYLTICYLKQKSFTKALPLALQLTKGNSVYNQDADFYAAYSYQQLDDKANARIYAEKVPKENSLYKFAKAILKDL